jgi:hypothetical protein
MITPREIRVLEAIARYYVLNRAQIQRLCFASDPDGRITRRHIGSLVSAGLLGRTQVQVVVPGSGSTAPVYFPSRKGCEFLAQETREERYLLTPTQTPNSQRIFHWLAVSETHLALDAALSRQSDVRCEGWLSEWDVANKDETEPEKRYRVYTLIQDKPRLVCAPDAAFLLTVDGHSKVHYLEQDRNTSGAWQLAASKTPGYAALAERSLHRRHFPEATLESFAVLMVAPTERRRDALKHAIAERPGAALWRFASASDLSPEAFLSSPVWHRCVDDPGPLIKPKRVGVAS